MDKGTLRTLMIGLLVIEVAIVLGIFYLLGQNKTVPDAIWTSFGAIITGVLGLAVPHDNTDQVNNAVASVASAISNSTPVVSTVVPSAASSDEESFTDPGVIPANLGA